MILDHPDFVIARCVGFFSGLCWVYSRDNRDSGKENGITIMGLYKVRGLGCGGLGF